MSCSMLGLGWVGGWVGGWVSKTDLHVSNDDLPHSIQGLLSSLLFSLCFNDIKGNMRPKTEETRIRGGALGGWVGGWVGGWMNSPSLVSWVS